MKVSTPIGEYPFTLERVKLRRNKLVIHGRMGVWPADIEVGGSDVSRFTWIGMGAAGALTTGLLAWRRKERDR